MRTYQDLIALGDNERARMDFALKVIREHKSTAAYKIAVDAAQYFNHVNPTIMRYEKFIFNAFGQAVQDVWSPNHKIACRYYYVFVTQLVQFLLGNGVSFTNVETEKKLGKSFYRNLKKIALSALNGGVAFGFWNYDHVDVFEITEFVPLKDEETGALRAGVRFWQLDLDKPLHVVLYEEDGYTEYVKRKDEDIKVSAEKRPYMQVVASSATGTEILKGKNYPGFPIVPFRNNENELSELIGMRGEIDGYDLMASGLVNNVDEGNLIYWIIRNAGGMDDIDDVNFLHKLRTTHVAHLEDGQEADAHTIDAPFDASKVSLDFLRRQLFEDAMALDVREIASGATTATQIKAAYEPLNSKADMFEDQVTEFIEGILELAGIDDVPTYTRSMLVNQQEMVQTIVTAGNDLPQEYRTRKILEILGDIDKAEDVLAMMAREEMDMFNGEQVDAE